MSAPNVLAIDIGGTTVKLALVRGGHPHAILRSEVIETLARDSAEAFVARVAAAGRELVGSEVCAGVGVGCPGLIDAENGVVKLAANLPNLVGFNLRDALAAALGLPAEIQNDANAAALGEFLFGANAGTKNLVLLTLGTGVGGGVICDGRLLVGADNLAAELGHVKVDFSDAAAACGCGRAGCLEAYAGANGIARIARAHVRPGSQLLAGDGLSTRSLAGAAAGDESARAALAEVGHYLGRGIANFIETFNPEKIVLGGGASGASEWFMPGIRAAMERYCVSPITRDRAKVERSPLADAINVLGPAAVFLGRNQG